MAISATPAPCGANTEAKPTAQPVMNAPAVLTAPKASAAGNAERYNTNVVDAQDQYAPSATTIIHHPLQLIASGIPSLDASRAIARPPMAGEPKVNAATAPATAQRLPPGSVPEMPRRAIPAVNATLTLTAVSSTATAASAAYPDV